MKWRSAVVLLLLMVLATAMVYAQSNLRVPPDPNDRRTLTVTKAGAGVGSVFGPGVTCAVGTTCTASYIVDTTTTIHATAASGSTFAGWSGACTGAGVCTVLMNQAQSVTATFDLAQFLLTVSTVGQGTITGSGIDCGADCTENYVPDTTVVLTATPSASWSLQSWSGCGSNPTPTTCSVIMSQARSVTATFNQLFQLTVTVSAGAGAGGTVTGSGISCGTDCTDSYPVNTVVNLTATPAAGSLFAGWSGACASSPCAITMTADKTVTAAFALPAQLTASWTAPTTNTNGSALTDLASYRIYYTPTPGTPCPGSQFVTATAPASSKVITPLTNGQSYTVAVTAINASGTESACSSTAALAAHVPVAEPSAPGQPQIDTPVLSTAAATFPVTFTASIDPATSLPVGQYDWFAGFNDGDASVSGSTGTNSMQLAMPYHSSRLAAAGFYCVRGHSLSSGLASTFSCNSLTVPALGGLTAPFVQSPDIAGISWDFAGATAAGVTGLALGSDLWATAWLSNDNLYIAWGDGGGFSPGDNSTCRTNTGIDRITGTPPNLGFVTVSGCTTGGAGCATDNGAANPQPGCVAPNGSSFNTAGVPDSLFSDGGNTLFVFSANNTVATTLYRSLDFGVTWTSLGISFPWTTGSLVPVSVVAEGANASGGNSGTAALLYIYFGKIGDTTRVYLARVNPANIATASAWEYFTGTFASPAWGSVASAQPVIIDPNAIDTIFGPGGITGTPGYPKAELSGSTYFPVLNRYIINWRAGNINNLRMYDAPNPWGPWTTAYSSDTWGGFSSTIPAVSYYIIPKFLSADNKTFWMTYSGTGAATPGDNYNLIKGTITTP